MQHIIITPLEIPDHIKNEPKKTRAYDILMDIMNAFKEQKEKISSKRASKKYDQLFDIIQYLACLIDLLRSKTSKESNEHLLYLKLSKVKFDIVQDYINNSKDQFQEIAKKYIHYNETDLREAFGITADHIKSIHYK